MVIGFSDIQSLINYECTTIPIRSTDFGLALGGGVDLNASKSIAVRVFQIDYLPVYDRNVLAGGSGKSWSSNFRAQVGLVFKFGQ